jgi:hypothetical protein
VVSALPDLFVLGSSPLGGVDVLGDTKPNVPVPVGGSFAITAPYFLIDVATVMSSPFILGSSPLGGGEVLGDFATDELGRIVSIYDFFPPYPRVSIVQAGLTISPTTNRLQAITGQAEAQVAGSQVQFNLITQAGVEFSVAAIYNGRRSVFVG